MKHNFSIRDIVGALKTVRGVKNYYSDAQLAHLVDEAREVNAILDALPDPGHQPVVMNYDLSEDIWDKARNVTGLSEDSARYADLIPESQLLVETALQLVVNDHSNPAPVADEWEQCEFSDIRKGDRVKRILTKFNGSTLIKEGVAEHHIAGPLWVSADEMTLASKRKVDPEHAYVTLFRIPAPVQHPDPKEHPVIFVRATEYREGDEPFAAFRYGDKYKAQWHDQPLTLSPESITDWWPGLVVADDRGGA